MATIGPVTSTDTTWECEITGLAQGENVFTCSDGTETILVTVEGPAVSHAIRAEAGGTPATVTLSPGADLVTASAEGSVTAPSLSAAPPLPTMAARGNAAIGSISATSPLGPMAAACAMVAPEILSPDTGHRIRAVCGPDVAVANLVPGADLISAGALGGAGAVALSAELALGTMAARALMSAPGLTLPLPAMAAAGAMVNPSPSGALALATMAAKGRMWAPVLSDGTGNLAPWSPYNPCLGTLPRPWWQRMARRH
jgi:hypothetical protein